MAGTGSMAGLEESITACAAVGRCLLMLLPHGAAGGTQYQQLFCALPSPRLCSLPARTCTRMCCTCTLYTDFAKGTARQGPQDTLPQLSRPSSSLQCFFPGSISNHLSSFLASFCLSGLPPGLAWAPCLQSCSLSYISSMCSSLHPRSPLSSRVSMGWSWLCHPCLEALQPAGPVSASRMFPGAGCCPDAHG